MSHHVETMVAQLVKICLQCRRPGFDLWVGKIAWSRAWQLTPVFLPGESPWQRSLAGYSSWGCKELDTTEQLILLLSLLGKVIFKALADSDILCFST